MRTEKYIFGLYVAVHYLMAMTMSESADLAENHLLAARSDTEYETEIEILIPHF